MHKHRAIIMIHKYWIISADHSPIITWSSAIVLFKFIPKMPELAGLENSSFIIGIFFVILSAHTHTQTRTFMGSFGFDSR